MNHPHHPPSTPGDHEEHGHHHDAAVKPAANAKYYCPMREGVYPASRACGLQNAMVSMDGGAVVRTTHLSGIFTDLGISLGHAMRGPPANWRRLRLCFLIISAFVCGGVAGTRAFDRLGFSAFFIPGALTAITSVGYGLWPVRRRQGVSP